MAKGNPSKWGTSSSSARKGSYRRSAKQTGGGHAECSKKRKLLKQRIQTLTAKVSVIESFLGLEPSQKDWNKGRTEEE